MARISVKLQDGRVGSVEDWEFNPATMTQLGASNTTSNTQTNTASKPLTVTGHTPEEHMEALQYVQSIGDTKKAKQIQEDLDKENQYQQLTKVAAEQVRAGQLKVTDLPADQQVAVSSLLTQSGYQPKKEKTPEEGELAAVLNLIDNLQGHYQESGAGGFASGPLAGVSGLQKKGSALLGLNDAAKLYENEKEGFVASLKGITGDTGVLTEQDALRLLKLLPDLGATTGVAKGGFNDLLSQVAAKYGVEAKKTTIDPKMQGLMDIIAPATKEYAENIGKARNELTDEQRIEKARAIGQNAQPLQLLINLLKGQKEAGELLAPTAEIAGLVTAPGAVKGGLSFLKGIPSKFSSAGSIAARETAAKGLTVNTKPLIQAGDDYVKNIEPAAQKAWETLKPAIKDTTDVPELLEKLSVWGSKAYTKSGDKRAITEGLLKDHLYKMGRKIIEQEAPQVAKYTKDISRTIDKKKILGKTAGIVGGAAATGATFALLNKLLGGGGYSSQQ